jgi:pyruvate/2-oxoglutarate dehydrogenase complex dihydrolipoamide acyltransferase (E2) component
LLQAAAESLKRSPVVNAVIDGDDIIYRDYVDVSIAVGTPKVKIACPFVMLLFTDVVLRCRWL